MPDGQRPVRVLISYAHDDAAHMDQVREFWVFLRSCGIDARLDLPAAEERVDWALWMSRQIRDADKILVIASPAYKRRAEGDAGAAEGRGVQWEARLVRDRFYVDQVSGLSDIVPVVLPGESSDSIPGWLAPNSTAHYRVSDYTVDGAGKLLRLLTGQPWETVPRLGAVPVLPQRTYDGVIPAADGHGLHTEVLIQASMSDTGLLDSVVRVAGTELCHRQAPLPVEVADVWGALNLPALAAGQRMADAGRMLATALLDDPERHVLARLLEQMPPGARAEVVLVADGPALSLPLELMLLSDGEEADPVPLGLMPGVSVCRRLAPPGSVPGGDQPPAAVPSSIAGPLKILAAVAGPDETKTTSVPLDIEAEMAAVLDAVTDAAASSHAQARILEVASLPAIRQALAEDAYHVLHLSAHGSSEMVELEDEDGNPVPVTPTDLMLALKHAGRPLPLIVLSSCSGGSGGTMAMAARLITRGADRVIAMLASVTDRYATELARHLYRELAASPDLTAGHALSRARYLTEETRTSQAAVHHLPAPEYGVATLLAAAGDGVLTDHAATPQPLTVHTTPPGGPLARDLPMGALIGRRPQLRAAMGILRRTSSAVSRYGAASGVQLTGIGGIGKTALAGRIITRLRDEGWLISIHEGRWNPATLITATAAAIATALPSIADLTRAAMLRDYHNQLTNSSSDDRPKLVAVAQVLARERLLVVFDDFEQNLSSGGDEFLDPAIDEAITALADAANTGALLLTTRYALPGLDRFLTQIPLPPLSRAELRRLFLRLPALHELEVEDKRLLIRTIGGHPRLIELTDALLRGGRASLRHVQVKLRQLARDQGLDVTRDQSPAEAIDQAMLLGSADILLTQLLALLTPAQMGILMQLAVCRSPMSIDDLAFCLEPDTAHHSAPGGTGSDLMALQHDVDRLTSLTLLMPGEDIVMHPWTAELIRKATQTDLTAQHDRALEMRTRRFEQGRVRYGELMDTYRHMAALQLYDDIAIIAIKMTEALPGTLATLARLAEIRPLIPVTERAWCGVADLEVQVLLRAGARLTATSQLQAIHHQVQERLAAEPGNIERQRDLLISHNKLGLVAASAGDLTAARASYEASLDIVRLLAAADPASTERLRDLSIGHDSVGSVAVLAGDLATARACYQASLDIRLQLATTDPANIQWQSDLSSTYDDLGDVAVSAGDLATARASRQASLRIVRRLAAADPANTKWLRDMSIALNKLGSVAVTAEELAAVRTGYQASLDLVQSLADVDPADTARLHDLSVTYNNLGDMEVNADDLTAARASYEASLDIRLQLAAVDPANTDWQRDLSISHDNVGDVAFAAGDLATARVAFQASLDIAERLAAVDPANTDWQRDLSISHGNVGDVAFAAGDLATARVAFQASLDIRERLAAVYPLDTGRQRGISVTLDKLGDVAIAAGDLATARTCYQASLEIVERIAAADPANTDWQGDLAMSHDNLGGVAVSADDLTVARASYEASLDIRLRLAAVDPANTGWQRDLSFSHGKVGDVAFAAGDLATARTCYQASLDIVERIAALDPANTEWQRDLAMSHDNLGEVAVDAGDLATARSCYQACLDIDRRLAAVDLTNTEWQRDLSVSHERLGDVAVAAGDLATARTCYQASLDIRLRLIAADPADTQWQRDVQVVRQKTEDLSGT